MSRLSTLRQLDTSTPEATKQSFARLVQLLDEMFDALPQQFQARLAVARDEATHASDRPALAFDSVRVVNNPSGAVYAYMPKATADDRGRGVAIDRRSTANPITVVPAGGQQVHSAASDSVPSGTGVHGYVWAGDMWRYRRGG